jgi:PadR family transcriptional regulator PadR
MVNIKLNIMGDATLGEFEEVIMLTVAILGADAYTMSIIDELHSRTGRKASVGGVQTVLKRLEDKGLLTSEFGEATSIRGGKRKRYYHVTPAGKTAMQYSRDQRMNLWKAIPKTAFN